jgi:hypothetical protein
MFLHGNRRIAALITVISLALLVFCLIEREARRNLAPDSKIDGLYNRQPASMGLQGDADRGPADGVPVGVVVISGRDFSISPEPQVRGPGLEVLSVRRSRIPLTGITDKDPRSRTRPFHDDVAGTGATMS